MVVVYERPVETSAQFSYQISRKRNPEGNSFQRRIIISFLQMKSYPPCDQRYQYKWNISIQYQMLLYL